MRHTNELPAGYGEIAHIDLQKDKRTAGMVNVAAMALMAVLLVLAHFLFQPISGFFSMEAGMGVYWARLAVLIVGYAAYLVLHELTHAAAMKAFGAGRVRFGFTGLYAYAGSLEDYFGKGAYRVIALAPLVFWGAALTVLLILVPSDWFWTVYLIQVGNIAGAMGDIYVTVKCAKMPPDLLVRDTGTEMFIYSAQVNDQ